MARGWESKSVEEQQEAAADRRALAQKAAVSAAEADLTQKRASLELSRTRIRRELEAATHPRRREQLRAALQHLQNQLIDLDEAHQK